LFTVSLTGDIVLHVEIADADEGVVPGVPSHI